MAERAKAAADASVKAASSDHFGDLQIIQSREISGRVWTRCVTRAPASAPQPAR